MVHVQAVIWGISYVQTWDYAFYNNQTRIVVCSTNKQEDARNVNHRISLEFQW